MGTDDLLVTTVLSILITLMGKRFHDRHPKDRWITVLYYGSLSILAALTVVLVIRVIA